ncbi:MAG TPA: hypothetical protein VJ938_08545 [Acidimicrobiia bacterium]|nr:hypothetical protein [Acidimicrobiia bacterium]
MLARPRVNRNGAASSTDHSVGGPAVLAYLTDTSSRALCYYAPCSHASVVALCDFNDTAVATYCTHHGRIALKEYGRALEEHLAEGRDSQVA